MNKTFTVKFQKVIGQLRFRPTLDNFHNVPNVAKEIEKDFEEWKAEGNSNITLYSLKSNELFQLTSGSLTFVKEGEDDFINDSSHSVDKLKNYLKDTLKKDESFAIEKIHRIGFRITEILETDFEFQDLVDLIYKKFYSDSEKINEIASDEKRDTVFVLDSRKNGCFVHTHIGPLKTEEVEKHLNSTFDLGKKISKNCIFIDVDVFIDSDLDMDNVYDNIDKIITENNRIVSDYVNYLNS